MSKIIAILLALALATLANSAHAEWQWKHFGAAPYAASRSEAMKTRESAFRKLGFPEQVVGLLVEETKKPGESVRLKNGDRFAAQISKGGVVHGLKEGGGIVAFEKPARGMEVEAVAEKWQVTWEGKVFTIILPEVCFNWTSIIAPAPKQAALSFVTSECPNGFALIANAWSLESLPRTLRIKAVAYMMEAESRDSENATQLDAYKPSAVSRTLGGQLRREVKIRAPIVADVRIRYLDPQTAKPVRDIGTLSLVNGIGRFQFQDDPRGWVVETIWPLNFNSPTISGGERRLRLFPNEWGKWCTMNVHGLVP